MPRFAAVPPFWIIFTCFEFLRKFLLQFGPTVRSFQVGIDAVEAERYIALQ